MSRDKRPRVDVSAQPHDSLVKYAFSKPAHAGGLLRAILPPSIAAAIAWSTLRLDKDTFISPVSTTHERYSVQQFQKVLKVAVGKKGEKGIMTLLEKFWAEGRAQTLLELLAAKFGPVPAEVRDRVTAADVATLRRWSLRVLTEETLAGVLVAPRPRRAKKAAGSKQARASRA